MTLPGPHLLIVVLLVGSASCATSAPAPTPAPTPAPAAEPMTELVVEPVGASRSDSLLKRGPVADAHFMRQMMAHHAQALTMSALVPARTSRDDLRLLAQRIDVSQRDEIAWIQRWLRDHGHPVSDGGSTHDIHTAHGAMQMPGMLSTAELERLAGSTAGEFDRLFIEYMIRHHEGALVMVAELLGSPGAGQEPALFRFASDVDADQRAEIARMRALLRTPPR